MAAAIILNLLFLFILVKRPISGSKILFIYVNRRPRYCCLCKNLKWWPETRVLSHKRSWSVFWCDL